MAVTNVVAARWRDLVRHTGAPAASALVAGMIGVTGLQYLILPALGVPADGTAQYRLFHFDPGHPGRLWTAATSLFAHGSVLHLAVNVHLVLGFGSLIEPRYSSRQFFAAFVAGTTGALAGGVALHLVGPATSYVGASGGAFGLLGWLAGREPDYELPTIPPGKAWMVASVVAAVSLLVVAVYGVSAFGIGHIPHLSGLVAGCGLGVLSR